MRGNVTDRKDDPAFIYFPTNYRWSMGLLLCLSVAPWGGAEIDEINRIGTALRDKLGDDMRKRLEEGVEKARTALRGDDVSAINAASEELSKLYSEAGQAFYQAQNQTAQPGEPAAAPEAEKPADDNVVEADYEIVDEDKK